MKHLVALVIGVLFAFTVQVAHAVEAVIYLSPKGDRKASGNDEGSAIDSLQVAIQRVLSQQGPKIKARRVVVLPGRYLEQVTAIENLPDDLPLIIAAANGPRPVFDGNGRGRTWLTLQSSNGRQSRLSIEGVEVTNYVTAISLNGDRASPSAFNSENVIRGNVFRTIGQIAMPSGKPSTAAIRLVNSRNNKIIQNQFIDIRNNTQCGLLHAVYMAHYSSNNLIEGNTFERGCGATVKTRDASNENIIRDNKFIEQEVWLFLDRYCEKDARDDCTKETSECPSWGNVFEGNTAERLGPKSRKTPVAALGPDNPTECVLPKAKKQRLSSSKNSM